MTKPIEGIGVEFNDYLDFPTTNFLLFQTDLMQFD